MTVFGDGFLPYHIEVLAKPGAVGDIKDRIKAWKSRLREAHTYPGFPGSLVNELCQMTDVIDVKLEGPQSAVLIPLRMAKGITGNTCTMSAVLGTGPIAKQIAIALREWDIDLTVTKRISEGDSPLEFSIRDSNGAHESVRLYPVSRTRFKSTLSATDSTPDCLCLNRYNQGLCQLAQSVAQKSGVVSLRLRQFGRYDRVEDYLKMFPFTKQLVLSTRHSVLKTLAHKADIHLPKLWPHGANALHDEHGTLLANWLLDRMHPGGIVIFTLYPLHSTTFYHQDYQPVTLEAPSNIDTSSRAARLQGSLLGNSMGRRQQQSTFIDQTDWQVFCNQVMNDAFTGTEQRPWIYPSYISKEQQDTG